MEPWPFSHGYGETQQEYDERLFGPSMEPWPFSHGYVVVAGVIALAGLLQWSHGPSAMDTGRYLVGVRPFSGPSMEPWPFSHGYGYASAYLFP